MNATFEEICSPKMAMLILKSPRATLMESESFMACQGFPQLWCIMEGVVDQP